VPLQLDEMMGGGRGGSVSRPVADVQENARAGCGGMSAVLRGDGLAA
jgi:hypothetical protein